MGDVLAGFGILHGEILALLHHDREIVQRHIGARARVVEPPVRIFLDDDLTVVPGH
jgi:hypothetical protein